MLDEQASKDGFRKKRPTVDYNDDRNIKLYNERIRNNILHVDMCKCDRWKLWWADWYEFRLTSGLDSPWIHMLRPVTTHRMAVRLSWKLAYRLLLPQKRRSVRSGLVFLCLLVFDLWECTRGCTGPLFRKFAIPKIRIRIRVMPLGIKVRVSQ